MVFSIEAEGTTADCATKVMKKKAMTKTTAPASRYSRSSPRGGPGACGLSPDGPDSSESFILSSFFSRVVATQNSLGYTSQNRPLAAGGSNLPSSVGARVIYS